MDKQEIEQLNKELLELNQNIQEAKKENVAKADFPKMKRTFSYRKQPAIRALQPMVNL